jgi:hypothetical protein
MPKHRQKSPGSFRDELGGLIERVGKTDTDQRAAPKKKPTRARVDDPAELNSHLFESAWRKSD